MKKAKGVKETKERFSIFPFLFSPLSPSTVKRSSGAGVAALEPGRHWLPGRVICISAAIKAEAAHSRTAQPKSEGKVPSVGGIHASSEPRRSLRSRSHSGPSPAARKTSVHLGAANSSPDLQTTEEITRSAFWKNTTRAGGVTSPARRGGGPSSFHLRLFSLCWVLSVAQSRLARYSTFEEDTPGTVIRTLAEDLHMKVSGRLLPPDEAVQQLADPVREGDGQPDRQGRGPWTESGCAARPLGACVAFGDVVSFSREQFRLVHVGGVGRKGHQRPCAALPPGPGARGGVREEAGGGHAHPLEVPVDEDMSSAANGLQSVRLASAGPFRVGCGRSPAGRCPVRRLGAAAGLDRGEPGHLQPGLVAQDGNDRRAPLTALSVRVLDANDHSRPSARGRGRGGAG